MTDSNLLGSGSFSRPPRSERRQRQVFLTVRCTPEEKQIAIDNADNRGMSLGDYIRSVAIGQKPLYVVRRHNEKAQAILLLKAELGKIGSNINQIAKVANTKQTVDANQIDMLLKALRLCHEEVSKLSSL